MTDFDRLLAREVHLWFASPEEITSSTLCERYLAILDAGERAQQARFRFAQHRQQYLVAHALVRATLSRYAPVAPEQWVFTQGKHGKPEIAGDSAPRLRFNLSHTDGLVVCAIALDHDLGVDVEDTERRTDPNAIAGSVFSAHELAALHTLPPEAQRERFFAYWTLKEAYIKARGTGLSTPLDQFWFHLDAPPPIRITFDPRQEDTAEHWQFARLRPTTRHAVAVALRRGSDADHTIVAQQTVPMSVCCLSLT